MSRHIEEKEIDGNTWMVSQLPATEGLKVLTKLIKIVGKPIGKAVKGVTDSNGVGSILDAKIDYAFVGDAIGDLTSRLDEEEVTGLIKRMFRDVRCDGKEVMPTFDTLFMGRYGTMMKVIVFVIGVNFKVPLADYLGGLASEPAQVESIREAI